jgi:hypothetical protein
MANAGEAWTRSKTVATVCALQKVLHTRHMCDKPQVNLNTKAPSRVTPDADQS